MKLALWIAMVVFHLALPILNDIEERKVRTRELVRKFRMARIACFACWAASMVGLLICVWCDA